ncbi:hypothetical protein [Microcystis phage Me-ZS1]|nr:hypothetical protein [Microcystis phage Me-ZS1]
MREVTGFIRASEVVENTAPVRGSVSRYLLCYFVQSGKPALPMFWTHKECRRALRRGKVNKEDLIPFAGLPSTGQTFMARYGWLLHQTSGIAIGAALALLWTRW